MEEMAELDLHELFRRLKKRWLLIVVITFIATTISAVVSIYFIKPVYEAQVGVILISQQNTNNLNETQQLSFAQSLIETYTEIAKTNKVASIAATKIGDEVTANELMEMTTVFSSGDSLIITLGVRNTDPYKALAYVEAYGEAFVERSKELIPEDDTRIMDGSQLPVEPISPNIKLNIAVAFAVGLMSSVGLALLFEYLNNTIIFKEDVERVLNMPVIGIIPENDEEKFENLIVEKQPKSPISEAYRTVRTNIEFSGIDKNIKKILVTSSGPDEGKSITASNLAIAFAQAGKKTLLIDCDFRKPSIYKNFRISNRLGMVNIIVDGANIFDMSQVHVEGLGLNEIIHKFNEKLDILTTGKIPPNPSEILGSNKMSLFLEAMCSKYDKVIIDSPPINAVTDAQLLATLVDGVVVVIASESTHINSAKNAKELLMKVGANIVGVVLRRLRIPKGKHGYGGYYYYSYMEDEDNEWKKAKKKKS